MSTRRVGASRPWTPDYVDTDGVTHMTMRRCCNGCGREIGDATIEELQACVTGVQMPDVRDECGCLHRERS